MRNIFDTENTLKNRKYWLVCLVLSILSASALLIASTQEKKWLVAVAIGLIMVYCSFVIQKKLWHLLILTSVFFIPIKLDFYLFLKPTYVVQMHGLPVSAFDILLTVLFLYWIFQILTRKEIFNFYPSVSIPALIYILLSGISAFQSADKLYSFLVFILMVKSYIVFIFFANKIKTQKELIYVILALISGVLLQSLVGGLQHVTGSLLGIFGEPELAYRSAFAGKETISRVGGTIGHPNALAKYLNLCLPVLLCVIFARFNTILRVLACLAFTLGAFTELLTLSRGGWLALSIALLFTSYEIFRFHIKSRAKSAVLVSLSVIFLSGIIIGGFGNVRSRLFENDYGSARSRWPMAVVAGKIIQEKPITGVGLNNYTTIMHTYDRTRGAQTYKFPHPVHNSYLLIAAESGIPALIAFLWVVVAVFVWAWPALKLQDTSIALLQIGWMGGLMTWLISGMFDRDFAGTNVMLWLTFAMVVASHRILFTENKREIGI